jgi:hypothetical protein
VNTSHAASAAGPVGQNQSMLSRQIIVSHLVSS